MITVPTLPTDNLYKFLALAGLVIVVLSDVLQNARMSAINEKLDALRVEAAGTDAESKSIDADLARGSALTSHERELLWQRRREHTLHLAESGARLAIVDRLITEQHDIQVWSDVASAIGAVLMILGFGLWYHKVQVYQDRLLRAQAKDT